MRQITIVTITFTLLLAGCVSNKESDNNIDSGEDSITSNLVNYMGFSGKEYLSETGVCIPYNGSICAGSWHRDSKGGFYVTEATQIGFVTAKWNSTNPALQNLDMFIYSGEYPVNYRVVVRDQGDSPLTLSFNRDDLDGHLIGNPGYRVQLGVGFEGDGPIRATGEQTIYWDAFVFTP